MSSFIGQPLSQATLNNRSPYESPTSPAATELRPILSLQTSKPHLYPTSTNRPSPVALPTPRKNARQHLPGPVRSLAWRLDRYPLWKSFCRQLTARKLLFNFFFFGIHIALFAVGWWKQAVEERLAGLNLLTYSVWISRGAGLVLTVDTTLILLPMCRTLLRVVRPKIKWLPLDESIWFHRQVAYQMLFWTVVHVTAHYVNFINVEKMQLRPLRAVDIHYTQPGGITGHIMLLCMLLIYTTAHASIRRQSFETFWYTHHLFIPFLLGMYTHAVGCFVRDSVEPQNPFNATMWYRHCLGYAGWRWELVGGGLYLIERLYREVRASRQTHIVHVFRHPYETVEIQFEKPSMKYKPGQWLFINCPQVSYFQWHPFTITSCPRDPYISIHMRQVGDFTRTFANALGAGPAQADLFREDELANPDAVFQIALQNGQEMPKIRIDGPYGAPAEDVFDHEAVVLVGTGIGITPWAAVLKELWHMRREQSDRLKIKKVELYWVCRSTSSFEWFHQLLSELEQQTSSDGAFNEGGDFLNIWTYLTARMGPDEATNVVMNSIGAEKDPVTNLRSMTNFGRPNWPAELARIRDEILRGNYIRDWDGKRPMGRTRVGVYFCGPSAAARALADACREATIGDVKFSFWKEHF